MTGILLALTCIVSSCLKQSYRQMAASSAIEKERVMKPLHISLKHVAFLSLFFDLIIFLALALFAIVMPQAYSGAWSLLATFSLLVVIFVVLPRIGANRASEWAARRFAGIFAYFLELGERPVAKVESLIERIDKKFHKAEPFSKKALLKFLREQEPAAEGDLKDGLKLALSALDLAPTRANHIMTRRKKAKLVSVEDHIGPILLSELHATGRKIFPAIGEDSQMVGTVSLDKLTDLKSGGKVAGALDDNMGIINKDDAVIVAINLFVESGHRLIFVQDEGEITGFIYLEDVLKELAG